MYKSVATAMLWVIHVSGIIGIALGNGSFFFPKSPLTLIYLAVVTIAFFPVLDLKKILLFALCFATGMGVEWIGVHTGTLFGDYHYGVNMGWKLDGIPYLIGSNWAILAFITHEIGRKITKNAIAHVAIGAGLMVLLDFFLEQVCDYAGFWHFDGGSAGWFNYLCWFLIAVALHVILRWQKLRGDTTISLHLFIVQLIFSIALWIIITT